MAQHAAGVGARLSTWRRSVTAVVGFALLAGASPAMAAAHPAGERASQSGTWGTAEEVPGSGALNTGNLDNLATVSCGAVGNCSAGGMYTDTSATAQPFVVSEGKGTWRPAERVPGVPAQGLSQGASVSSLSCRSAGNCTAGGSYVGTSLNTRAFVVSETHGAWRAARQVPGATALGGQATGINSVSCASAGNCGAGGYYVQKSGVTDLFVVNQTDGTWGNAAAIQGLAALDAGGRATMQSISCPSAGNCVAVGGYVDSSDANQVFLVSETNGTWGTAEEIPGTATLNAGNNAQVYSVSCASAGNCSVGGFYTEPGTGFEQAFVASEVNGAWGDAQEVPGIGALNQGGFSAIDSVSCPSNGNCGAGGNYSDSTGGQAFVVSEVNGVWGTAQEVPGSATLNQGGQATITSVSCASAGNCSAGGSYLDSRDSNRAFQTLVAGETDGTWGIAAPVPGGSLFDPTRSSQITSISCATAEHCSAGGTYVDTSGNQQVFVVNET